LTNRYLCTFAPINKSAEEELREINTQEGLHSWMSVYKNDVNMDVL